MKHALLFLFALPYLIPAQNTVLYSDTLPFRGEDYTDSTYLPTFIEITQYKDESVWIHMNLTPDRSESRHCIDLKVKLFKVRKDGYMFKCCKNSFNIVRVIATDEGVVIMPRYLGWVVFHSGVQDVVE